MSVLPALELIRHTELRFVLDAVDDDHVPYAGGTELVPALRLGLRRPTAIVDLKRVHGLTTVEVDAPARRTLIGAGVTHRELATNPAVAEHAPTLAGAAAHVGNARVRSTGTIGGNLCFAEPRSDLGCILVALDASCEVRSSRATRRLPIADLLVGAFEISLEADEILTEVAVPFEPVGLSYWKLQSFERPTLGVALIRGDASWEITVGAATERPTRVVIDVGDTIAVDTFVDGLELSDDLSGSPSYKRAVVRTYLAEALRGPAS
jgi:carbon-monoxide dehydrogenase medium subunit